MARVFVGVPTKNRPDYVQEAVGSILCQSFQDFRVVVSDNCSNEDAVTRVRNYVHGLRDPRVSYVLQAVDGQEYGQGRFLFGECTEEYFVILHDDDRLEPEHLERALRVLDQGSDISVFGTRQYLIDEHGRRLPEMTVEYSRETKRDQVPEGRIADMLDYVMGAGVFSISGSVFRSSTVREYGLVDSDCEGLVPFEFNIFLRQAEHGATAYYTTRELVAYRFHGGRQGSYAGHWYWNQQQNETMTRLLERRRFTGSPERWRRRLLAKSYCNYAYIMFVVNRWRDGYRMLVKALRHHPLRWQVWAYCGFALCCPFLIRRLCRDKVKLLPK